MTPDQLRAAGEELYGQWGWQTKLARTLDVSGSTVRRWLSGATTMSGPTEIAIKALLKEKKDD